MPFPLPRNAWRLLLPLVLAGAAQAAPAQRYEIEIFHWWVSGGERASIDVLRAHVERQGIPFREGAQAGSGTARYGDALRRRVAAGRAPTAAQSIGYDIHEWARLGLLENLDEMAAAGEWDKVVPNGIQHLSKYRGHWVAAPINAHSTNWMWLNKAQFDRIGGRHPDGRGDLIELLKKARAPRLVPPAPRPPARGHPPPFQAGAGRRRRRGRFPPAPPPPRAQALKPELLLRIFRRMSQLRGYLGPGFARRSWDQATDMVRRGEALLQVQGTWVNGEFSHRGLQPEREYLCFRFPDTQGIFLFNSDQYVFFKDSRSDAPARQALAAILLDPVFQRDLNLATGAAPGRVDVPRDAFNRCGRQNIDDLRGGNMRRTVMGSVAMGNANPSRTKTAIYKVVSDHLSGRIDDAQAVRQLQRGIADSVR